MGETATQLSGLASLEAASPHPPRKSWQAPTIIKNEDQSLASVMNYASFYEDGQPGTNES